MAGLVFGCGCGCGWARSSPRPCFVAVRRLVRRRCGWRRCGWRRCGLCGCRGGRRGRTGTRPRRGRRGYERLSAPAFAPVLRAGPGTSPPTVPRCRLPDGGTAPYSPARPAPKLRGVAGPGACQGVPLPCRNGDPYGGSAAYGRWSEGMSGAPPAGLEQTPGCLTSGTRAARAEDGVPGVPSDPPPTRRRRTANSHRQTRRLAGAGDRAGPRDGRDGGRPEHRQHRRRPGRRTRRGRAFRPRR